MISFNAITKRSDFYISTPIDDYVLTLQHRYNKYNCKLSKKFVLKLKIIENKDKKILSKIEKLSLDTVIKNNKKWFHNNLEYQDIVDNYLPCFNEQDNTLDIILHLDYFPKLEGYTDFDDFIKNKHINCLQNITIKLIGIYIKNNSFYVRWLVRNIEKIEKNNDDIQNIDELFDIKYERLIEKMIIKFNI